MNRAHRIADQVRSVVGWLQKDSASSQFVTKGFLSPGEFVEAGDQLTCQTPTWQWQSCDQAHQVFWLPPDKQYLITRNIPCRYRIHHWEKNLIKGAHETREGWLIPGPLPGDNEEPATGPLTDEASSPAGSVRQEGSGEQDAMVAGQSAAGQVVVKNFVDEDEYVDCGPSVLNGQQTVSSRTYDLSITYDKYYQSPRLWLFGYDEAGVPLIAEHVFEDIHNDYLARTVTVDPHPFTGVPTVSIHPCKHASVMRTVAQNWVKAGMKPRPDLALFILLKMVSSVVPTINYDFTIDVEMPMEEVP
ncbi:autophagy-related protein 3 [Gregarina niphandrodes]|uniref:Autophagy-related protein 3 n=1 Tax=Gregarina niphandrodes TaxID=110365 RepID=A0A023B2T5_GRENI|nr:autophagy-related protein 3 [Gregarina niphandrodes]EZG51722.1 autophagy-related protein 3 [Gregarina niphandrodes]|eukprot:XP_011131935.1 autophagy-related protein 3 [Gregarina niphandrodes]